MLAVAPSIDDRLEGATVPDDLSAAITHSLALFGQEAAYGVRSSATAQDLPTASFAGQRIRVHGTDGYVEILS